MAEAEVLRDEADAVLRDVVALRRRIHRRPELGLELPETQRAVLDAIGDLDLDVRTGTRTTSVVADLHGTAGDGPTILLRADMDALPMPEDTGLEYASTVDGAMHACGHDGHTAMLAGAARVLHEHRDELTGTVRFAFQPGEEGFHGARVMVEEGVVSDPPRVDAAFAIHVTPNIPAGMVATRPGTFMASTDDFEIVVRGRGGHASTPHLGNDPVPVACEIVQALQTFVTRRIDAFDPAVLTVGKLVAGTTENVVPETATLVGTLRTVSEATRAKAKAGLERVVAGIAQAHDMRAEISVVEGYPVTVNHHGFARYVQGIAAELLGGGNAFELPSPVMGAEDFSYVLQQVPGAMVFLGVCPDGVDAGEAPGCHSNRMTLDEDALATGVALHVAVARDHLGGGFTA